LYSHVTYFLFFMLEG